MTASYYDFRAEQRADFYAALGHLARTRASDSMLELLSTFRTMALVTWDLAHYTAPSLNDASTVERAAVLEMDLPGRVQFAMHRIDGLMMTAEQYRDFVAAAVEVSLTLGDGAGAMSPMHRELLAEERRPDATLVRQLIARVRTARSQLSAMRLSRR